MQRMKKYIYCALMALLCIACSKEDDPLMDTPVVIPKTLYAQAPVFESRAVFEDQPVSWDDSETVDSRTYAVIDEGGATYTQYWSPGDAISLFFTTNNLQYQMNSYQDGVLDIGKFDLVGSASEGSALSTHYCYSVYPYKASTEISKRGKITYTFPDVQHYTEDSYANGENGMIAIEPIDTDSVIYFKNFCSYLQLRLIADEGMTKKVSKITLTANNTTDRIAGPATIEIEDENSAPIVEMKRSSSTSKITLDCGSGVTLSQDANNPSKFWFVLPGGFTFTEGFRVTVFLDDNSIYNQSTSKVISIERNHIKPMATLTPIGTITTQAIRYKFKDETITKPYSLTSSFFDENGAPLDVVDQVYDEETGEWVVHLSGTLKTVGGNSFKEQEPELEYIKINNEDESITIGDFAFYNCTAERIEINNDVDAIKVSAFTGSTTKDLVINGNVTTIKQDAGTGSHIETIQISGDIETIEKEAFSGCKEIQSIKFANVGSINEEAFSGCTSLETIDLGNVGSINNQAFNGCTSLETVDLGIVGSINEQAFNGCSSLLTVEMDEIESIGYQAFLSCTNLTTVDIPGVKHLGMGAFRDCISLTEISLMSVVTIEDNAFMDCSGLTTAWISENCTMIGEGAFCNAINLQEVYCYAVYPPFLKTDNYDGSYVFDNVHDDFIIYIPMGSLEDYYLDDEYFEGQEWPDPNIEAEMNWWYEEYEDYLEEVDFSTLIIKK